MALCLRFSLSGEKLRRSCGRNHSLIFARFLTPSLLADPSGPSLHQQVARSPCHERVIPGIAWSANYKIGPIAGKSRLSDRGKFIDGASARFCIQSGERIEVLGSKAIAATNYPQLLAVIAYGLTLAGIEGEAGFRCQEN